METGMWRGCDCRHPLLSTTPLHTGDSASSHPGQADSVPAGSRCKRVQVAPRKMIVRPCQQPSLQTRRLEGGWGEGTQGGGRGKCLIMTTPIRMKAGCMQKQGSGKAAGASVLREVE